MSLRDIQLKIDYRSDEDNIVDDFYIPCLSNSREYVRAVGYFTSASLAIAGKGLHALLANGGKMRLVASAALTPEDLQGITRGYAARVDVIERALLRAFDPVLLRDPPNMVLHRLDCLAWLIAEERLEIRIACPLHPEQAGALYHEKMGIFLDDEGNAVAFTGSANETAGGLTANFECVDAYWSWSDHHGRVARKLGQFERLWSNRTPGLEVLEFPEAVRKVLLTFKRNQQKPDSDPETSIGPAPAVPLRPYQEEAVLSWFQHECRGLFVMATGSGKTITALSAVDRWLNAERGGFVLIACPYQHLVEQWATEAARFALKPILAFESSTRWAKALGRALLEYQYGLRRDITVITTHASLAGVTMQKFVERMHGHFLFVADEAHHFGAPGLREKLPTAAQARLGLSATPDRWLDDQGTAAIRGFFGPSVYEYSLTQAIQDGRLTPYYYHPHLVTLSEAEQLKYRALSRRIARLYAEPVETQRGDQLEKALRDRANILNTASGKLETLRKLVEPHRKSLSRALFYCSPQHVDAVVSLLHDELGMHVERFTARESTKDRQNLLAALASGDIQGLIAIRCLDEGVDVPSARVAYILASSSNPREFVQRRGRLLRLAPGKGAAVIHDLLTIPATNELDERAFEAERNIVRRELMRFKEFASAALNFFEAHEAVLPLAGRYRLMDL